MRRAAVGLLLLLQSVLCFAQDGPDVASHSPSQAAADILRQFAATDAAFITAGLINKNFDRENLASLIQYPTDGIVVVNLTGSEIKQALERSVSLYPQPNPSFLQLSGVEATFSRSAPIGQRIVSASIGGSKLDEKRTYSVAMPESLGQGGSGYFKIWDTSKIVKKFDKATVDSLLRGKRASDSSPRWQAVG